MIAPAELPITPRRLRSMRWREALARSQSKAVRVSSTAAIIALEKGLPPAAVVSGPPERS